MSVYNLLAYVQLTVTICSMPHCLAMLLLQHWLTEDARCTYRRTSGGHPGHLEDTVVNGLNIILYPTHYQGTACTFSPCIHTGIGQMLQMSFLCPLWVSWPNLICMRTWRTHPLSVNRPIYTLEINAPLRNVPSHLYFVAFHFLATKSKTRWHGDIALNRCSFDKNIYSKLFKGKKQWNIIRWCILRAEFFLLLLLFPQFFSTTMDDLHRSECHLFFSYVPIALNIMVVPYSINCSYKWPKNWLQNNVIVVVLIH